jgi:hypothetical protein
VQQVINRKKYEKEAAQAGEITKQSVTWYIFYSGGRFSWSSKWHQVSENPLKCWYTATKATWYHNQEEHNMKLEPDFTVIAAFYELLINVH